MADTTWQPLPESVTTLEDLARYLNGPGKGRATDLCGRHMRNVGGYAVEYGYAWTELPLPHWRLPFLSDGTRIRNGDLKLSPRVQLVSLGRDMAMHNITLTGAGNPEEDERTSFLVNGGDMTLEGCAFSAVGVYAWEAASLTLATCTVARGLHCVYAWGPASVSVTKCDLSASEGSVMCARDGARVRVEASKLSGSKHGSGIWAGNGASVTANECQIGGNAEFAAEVSRAGTVVQLAKCDCGGNSKGVKDEWDGGQVKIES